MRVLVFRMSSLGDLILSTSFLETLPSDVRVDWVVASDFEFVLRGHPKIKKLFVFQKKTGILGWIRLLGEISKVPYDVRVDLHKTPRTRIASVLLYLNDILRMRRTRRVSISKERIKTLGVLVLKGLMPKPLQPTPYWIRFARAASKVTGGSVNPKRPSYLSVLESSGLSEELALQAFNLESAQYFCLMPASRWRTKEWGPESFFELALAFSKRGLIPVLLGRDKDPACQRLKELLDASGVRFVSALQEPDFRISALLLKNASFFVGCDTGLSHLSEAVGCRTHVVFGPTRPEIGFGPCQSESKSISLPIGCAPCSKDGKHCYRIWSPYECMKALRPEMVIKEILP